MYLALEKALWMEVMVCFRAKALNYWRETYQPTSLFHIDWEDYVYQMGQLESGGDFISLRCSVATEHSCPGELLKALANYT